MLTPEQLGVTDDAPLENDEANVENDDLDIDNDDVDTDDIDVENEDDTEDDELDDIINNESDDYDDDYDDDTESDTEDDDDTVTDDTESDEKVFNLTINGEQYQATEEQVVALAQKAAGADEKFREAAEVRKDTMALLDGLKTDPFTILENLGVDITPMAQEYVYNQLKYQNLPESERKAIEAEKRAEAAEKKLQSEQSRQKQLQEQQIAQMQQQYQGEYVKQMQEALPKIGLPVTEQSIALVADTMVRCMDRGYEVTVEQAAEYVKEQLIPEQATSPKPKKSKSKSNRAKPGTSPIREKKAQKKQTWSDYRKTLTDAVN